jgi:F420-non-reducing hydrogenase iron-sulfur subunit
MPQQLAHPDIIVYLCSNCIPSGIRLPRQWTQQAAHVLIREVPCSGKMDGQYLLHGLEGGASGVCVVACPKGECHLAQGNYRAEIRLRTLQRLLGEFGMEPQRVELVHCATTDPPEQLEGLVRGAVGRIAVLGESPLRSGTK